VYSNDVYGGYGERMLLSASRLIQVPNGLDPWHAALTEPMAVGLHAVNRADVWGGDGAVVFGCGPVGLSVIAALKQRGAEPIVATDSSAARRDLAATMGAHEVIDPREESAWATYERIGRSHPLVVFEATGTPGMLNGILRGAPTRARVVVVGGCVESDTIEPLFGINKELDIHFALSCTPVEFTQCLSAIADGEIDVAPMMTGEVGLDGVPAAFQSLDGSDAHCKIIVNPARTSPSATA
jgi:threonine dehydrogenase-like Zn-dependent dehydrogenase